MVFMLHQLIAGSKLFPIPKPFSEKIIVDKKYIVEI